jgi:outer membrane protein OmpA-like peptidoglycan-associated protein
VRAYLVEQGVEGSQIIIQAEGESRPRRPNETESGRDNPEGRRANRRTEIYLDF